LGTSLKAGIDLRKAWARETEHAHGAVYNHLKVVGRGIGQGESLTDALQATEDFFPPLFHEMVRLGEATGHLDAVFQRLADHYQNQITLRRTFVASILWPMVQLGIAIFVVGGLIWFTGVLRELTNMRTLDPLGLGLVGNSGLAIYVSCVAVVGVLIFATVRAIHRGALWVRPIQYLLMELPVIGKAFRTLALARLAWALHVTLDAGMDLRKALTLSLRSTENAEFVDEIPQITAEITAGHSLHEAFSNTGDYPADFLDTLAVGEDSGQVVESMGALARQYQEQSRAAIAVLTMAAGWLVWAAVAAIIIAVVFRVFMFYLNVLNSAAT
jgi:type IV pilus assembly protein PilC